MARNINEFKINLDWVILGESKIDGDYTIEEKSGTYSAIAKQNGVRVGSLFTWSHFPHWEHGDGETTVIRTRNGRFHSFEPFAGKKFYIILLGKGVNVQLDPAKVEAALDNFNCNCFNIYGPSIDAEKIKVLQSLGIDTTAEVPSPRPEDNGAMVPISQCFKICYIIK